MLASLVLLSATGPMLFFKVKQLQVRHEIKQKIKAGVDEKDLHLIKIPLVLEKERNDIFKRIDSKEFRYKGNMYDIVKQEKHESETWYYCIADEEEEELFAQLDELVEKEINDKQGKEKQQNFPTNTVNLFFSDSPSYWSQVIIQTTTIFSYSFGLKTWESPPLSEPPRA